MLREVFLRDVGQYLHAIGLCVKNHLIGPAIALIYSYVDAMAWVQRPSDQDDVRAKDFEEWVEKYLLPGSGLPCTARDL